MLTAMWRWAEVQDLPPAGRVALMKCAVLSTEGKNDADQKQFLRFR